MSSKDTTHPSYAPLLQRFIRSIFWTRLQEDHTAHRKFCILIVSDCDNPKIEKKFIISFPPKYTARDRSDEHVGFRRGRERDRLSEGLLESGCGWNEEGR